MPLLDEFSALIDALEAAESFDAASEALTSWARALTGCEASLLRLVDNETGWLPACTQHGNADAFLRDETLIRSDECVCGLVASGRRGPAPYFTAGGSFVWGRMQSLPADFDELLDGAMRGRCVLEGYDSIAVFALFSGTERVGSLHLSDFSRDLFDAEVIETIERACAVAGRVLMRHRRQEREHEAFSLIQQALLPPNPPRIQGLDVGIAFSSASDIAAIGGDFYDILQLGPQRTLLVVGDYSGKGIEAAGLAARARHTISALATQQSSPAALLSAANRALAGRMPRNGFVTCALCLVEVDEGLVRLALAGHPPPLKVGAQGVEELDTSAHVPLGVVAEPAYDEKEFALAPGDVLVLYTDGVSESRRDGIMFGAEGIARVCEAACAASLTDLAWAVCAESSAFHAPDRSSDDRLVLAVCRLA